MRKNTSISCGIHCLIHCLREEVLLLACLPQALLHRPLLLLVIGHASTAGAGTWLFYFALYVQVEVCSSRCSWSLVTHSTQKGIFDLRRPCLPTSHHHHHQDQDSLTALMPFAALSCRILMEPVLGSRWHLIGSRSISSPLGDIFLILARSPPTADIWLHSSCWCWCWCCDPCSNTRSDTLWSVPSSPERSFLKENLALFSFFSHNIISPLGCQ